MQVYATIAWTYARECSTIITKFYSNENYILSHNSPFTGHIIL